MMIHIFKQKGSFILKFSSFLIIAICVFFTQVWGQDELELINLATRAKKIHDVNIGYRHVNRPVPLNSNCLIPQAVIGETTTIYAGAAVEPSIAVNPKDRSNIVACWQQGRIDNGGALEIGIAFTKDGGISWKRTTVPLQICIGGISQRLSDGWLSYAPDGKRVYLCALILNISFVPTTTTQSGIIASVSKDGGASWSRPHILFSSEFFVEEPTGLFPLADKNSITADRNHSKLAYAVWDTLPLFSASHSYTTFSRTTDGGKTWSPSRMIYNPFPDLTLHGLSNGIENDSQTINNVIVVSPKKNKSKHLSLSGDLLNFMVRTYAKPGATDEEFITDSFPFQFTLFDIAVIRSRDQGKTWENQATVVTPFEDRQVFTGGYNIENGEIVNGIGTQLRTGDNIPSYNVNPKNGFLYVVWQTGQFSADQLPQIAISTSRDGGITWSSAAQVSRTPANAPNSQAFTPFVAVTTNGYVGILYSDFRNDDKSNPNETKTDTWLAIYREVKKTNEGSTGIGLDFVREERLSLKSYIAQSGPRTSLGVMTNGDYSFLDTHNHHFYAIYTQSEKGPFAPPVPILNDTQTDTLLLLDKNHRTAPFVSIVKP